MLGFVVVGVKPVVADLRAAKRSYEDGPSYDGVDGGAECPADISASVCDRGFAQR